MAVELDTLRDLFRLAADNGSRVARVGFHTTGGLGEVMFDALTPGASGPAFVPSSMPTDRAPPDEDDASGDASGFRVERIGPTWPSAGDR